MKDWDRVILGLYTCPLCAMFIVAALDAGRFQWPATPPLLRALGWGELAIAGVMILWAMTPNTFLSEQVCIQTERRHWTIATGPYQYVRPPWMWA
jgi:protein-S-isoprenylcysteine O-methyltransferase Ste14